MTPPPPRLPSTYAAPGARIHAAGFEDFTEPDGSYDLVIGNVPFAKVSPYDPRHNRGGATTGVSGISELRECAAVWRVRATGQVAGR